MNVARVLIVAALVGCQPLAPVVNDGDEQAIASLQASVNELAGHVSNLERTASAATSTHEDVSTELTAHSLALARVETVIASLPDMIKSACPPAPRQGQAECAKETTTTRVPISGDKMIVGVREYVLADPYDIPLVARVDAGTAENFLYVSELVEFQRDSANWVRFALTPPKADAPVEVERQITRRKGGESSKDVAIRLRVTLGDVTETYEFTLQTRRTRDYQVRLGRTFLKDIALVDVSKRFIQPRPRPNGP